MKELAGDFILRSQDGHDAAPASRVKRSILPLPLQLLSFTLKTEEVSFGLGMWIKILLRYIGASKDLGVRE
jgi:hypothetical protein